MTKGERFAAFLAERETRGDWARFISSDRSRLIRKHICTHCNFSRSTLYQNSVIKRRLADTESQLRKRGLMLITHSAGHEAEMENLVANVQLENKMASLEQRLSTIASSVQNLEEQFRKTEQAAGRYPLPEEW